MTATRTQTYARRAYTCIEAVKGTPIEKKYGALALSFPVMVLKNGLAQATGFLLAKAKDEHIAYLNDLARVLNGVDGNADGNSPGQALHRTIIATDLTAYQRYTRNTLDAAAWMKRYAQGLLKAEATDGDQQ
ncbi:MAG: type III-B CRISPR module-associated protein Cmr5 [Rhodocyclaceae bacterium]|nr:type III-B CRISPR module-associated protein Cmr5 [Rhodocyclaceae bacterium]